MSKHTPGPWEVETHSEKEHFIPKIWSISKWGSLNDCIAKLEDVQLAAAAPELLEALKTALQVLENKCDPEHEVITAIRAAIAKAEEKA